MFKYSLRAYKFLKYNLPQKFKFSFKNYPSPLKGFNKFSFNNFSTNQNEQHVNKKDNAEIPVDVNNINNEDVELRQIQLNPKYEAGISFFVTGEYERSIKILSDLKKQLREENMDMNDDYLFLLKKIISINKVNKTPEKSVQLLVEIKEISEKIYKHDFAALFENLEFAIINFNHIDPALTVKFIDDLLSDSAFPQLFEQIFVYYKASSIVLEGKSLETAISLFEALEKDTDDKYLKGCILNNKACAKWWITMSKYFKSVSDKTKLSYEVLESFAKDMIGIVKTFKDALISIEEIPEFKFEDKINFDRSIILNEENVEEVRKNFLKYILSINFDLLPVLDSDFLKQMGKNKVSLTSIKTSAIIFSNLGEFYYNIKEYKKSLILLNAANLFFQNFSNNDPLFFKNLSIVAMNNWKLTNKSQSPKQMFEKILSQIKQFEPNYEKVYVFRVYGEMLLEENSQNILGNNLIDEANNMEEKIPHFECRRIYLTLPTDS